MAHFIINGIRRCTCHWKNVFKWRLNVSQRIIRVWNSLPPSTVSFKSLLLFRNSLGNVNYWSVFFYFVFIIDVFGFLAYAWFCVCYFYMHVFADYVACKWRHSPFVTLIINKWNYNETAWVSVLSVTDSMQVVQQQRMHTLRLNKLHITCNLTMTMTNLVLPNQFATTATTGGQPVDWNMPHISCTHTNLAN